MENVFQVGMGELRVAYAPDRLMTAGLGSCIGVCLLDRDIRLGGLVHIMLPSAQAAKSNQNRGKFADSGILWLIEEMAKKGAMRARLVAKIAGGAQMFKSVGDSDIMRIGERNAEAVIRTLGECRIPILARDVGGNVGRTIVLDPGSGSLLVRTIGQGERVI